MADGGQSGKAASKRASIPAETGSSDNTSNAAQQPIAESLGRRAVGKSLLHVNHGRVRQRRRLDVGVDVPSEYRVEVHHKNVDAAPKDVVREFVPMRACVGERNSKCGAGVEAGGTRKDIAIRLTELSDAGVCGSLFGCARRPIQMRSVSVCFLSNSSSASQWAPGRWYVMQGTSGMSARSDTQQSCIASAAKCW